MISSTQLNPCFLDRESEYKPSKLNLGSDYVETLNKKFGKFQVKYIYEVIDNFKMSNLPSLLFVHPFRAAFHCLVGVAGLVSGVALSTLFALGAVFSNSARKGLKHSIEIVNVGLQTSIIYAIVAIPVIGHMMVYSASVKLEFLKGLFRLKQPSES